MARTVGFIEIMTAVTQEFDAELREEYPPDGRYMAAAKWDKKPTQYASYRAISPFLNKIEARLKDRFGKAAKELDLNPGKSALTTLYAQPVQQTVLYVTGSLLKVLAVSPDAKLV